MLTSSLEIKYKLYYSFNINSILNVIHNSVLIYSVTVSLDR